MTKPTMPTATTQCAPTARIQTSLRTNLMFAASAGIIAVAMPGGGIYGTRAFAQEELPTNCEEREAGTDSSLFLNGDVDPGETIACASNPPSTPIDPLIFPVDDLTLIVGPDAIPTTVSIGSTGSANAIYLYGSGDMRLEITESGTVSDPSVRNIDLIYMYSETGDLTLINNGLIQFGTESQSGDAIFMDIPSGSSGDILLQSSGKIIGYVYTNTLGYGSTTIDVNDITSANGHGLYSFEQEGGGISVTARGTIKARDSGIVVQSLYRKEGVQTKLDIQGSVTGGETGIAVYSENDVVIDLSATGSITGTTEIGLDVETSLDEAVAIQISGNATTPTGTITGATYGLKAVTQGGTITIENLDTVSADQNSAVSALSNGGDILIRNIREVFHKNGSGINANSQYLADIDGDGGDGSVSIQNVSINPQGSQNARNVNSNGITAQSGRGSINIGADPNVQNSEIGDIFLDVDGTGIVASSLSGEIIIATSGGISALVGNSSPDQSTTGIRASVLRQSSDAPITITSGGLIDTDLGIAVQHGGTGKVTVNTFADIEARGQQGIVIDRFETFGAPDPVGDIEVTTNGEINSFRDGIRIDAPGGGNLSVTANANITSDQGDGIDFETAGAGISKITVNAVVTGDDTISSGPAANGVEVNKSGAGAVQLYLGSTGVLQSLNGDGAEIVSTSDEGTILVKGTGPGQTGKVSGTEHGLFLQSENGAITVEDLESVTSEFDIPAGGSKDGIRVQSNGGDVRINNIGNVGSEDGAAIFVNSDGGDVSIQSLSIQRLGQRRIISTNGIIVNSGKGPINIGAEQGQGDSRIENIQANVIGIAATTNGGDIRINTAGTVDAVTSGIALTNLGDTGTINATVLNVKATARSAIILNSASRESTSLTINGEVLTRNNSSAVNTTTTTGAIVTISETGSITEGGIAFEGNGTNATPNDTFTLFGSITDEVNMNGGNDTFNLGSFAFDTVNGGDGSDRLNITGAVSEENAITVSNGVLSRVLEFENLSFNATFSEISETLDGWEQIEFLSGTTTLLENVTMAGLNTRIFDGATLRAQDGSSLIGSLTNAGILSIGSSPGLFSIDGDFVQTSTGVMPIEFEGNVFDQLDVTGRATLDGTLSVVVLNMMNPDVNRDFVFLTAQNGVFGEFSDVVDGIPDLNFETIYDTNTVALRLALDPALTDPPEGGENPSPGGAGDGGDGIAEGPDLDPNGNALLSAKHIAPTTLSDALQTNDMFAETLMKRRAGALEQDQWSFWANGFGGTQKVGRTGPRHGWQSDTRGYGIGMERYSTLWGAPILYGISAGYSESAVDSLQSFGNVESYHLGAFVRRELDAWNMAGVISHAWQDFDFTRYLIGETFFSVANGETDGSGWTLKSDLFYDFNYDEEAQSDYAYGPIVTFDTMIGRYGAFKETDAAFEPLNLSFSPQHAYQTVFGLGGQARFDGQLGDWNLDSGLRLTLESVGGDQEITTRARFDAFNVGVRPQSAKLDAERISVGLDGKLYLSDGVFAHIRYDTAHSERFIDHEGWAGITIAF